MLVRSIAAEGCYFVLIQSNQRSSQQRGFLAHKAFTLQAARTTGCNSLPLLRSRKAELRQVMLCPCKRTGHHCSARFRPKLFCCRGNFMSLRGALTTRQSH